MKKNENFYLTEKIKNFLIDIEKLKYLTEESIKLKNEIVGLKKVNNLLDDKKTEELKEQLKLLEKTLSNVENDKIEQKNFIIETYGNKIFILYFRKLDEYKNLNDYDLSIIDNNIYFPFEFYVKELKSLLKKLFLIKKEKINSNLEVLLLN